MDKVEVAALLGDGKAPRIPFGIVEVADDQAYKNLRQRILPLATAFPSSQNQALHLVLLQVLAGLENRCSSQGCQRWEILQNGTQVGRRVVRQMLWLESGRGR